MREVVERTKKKKTHRETESEKKADKVSCFGLSEAQLLQLSVFKCMTLAIGKHCRMSAGETDTEPRLRSQNKSTGLMMCFAKTERQIRGRHSLVPF